VLGYFSGGKRKRVGQYREFVEGELGRKEKKWAEPAVLKQAFIGDEDFVERVRKKLGKTSVIEGHTPLKRIVKAVGQVSGVAEEEIRRPGRDPGVQRARELLCYVSRRHSDVSLEELARFLGVKELSTPSHGVRRAEQRIKTDRSFRRQIKGVLSNLGYSSMQP
jgi:chromosomal replication initiation ATPase DnaA